MDTQVEAKRPYMQVGIITNRPKHFLHIYSYHLHNVIPPALRVGTHEKLRISWQASALVRSSSVARLAPFFYRECRIMIIYAPYKSTPLRSRKFDVLHEIGEIS
jgi:hypothetical protein